VRIYVSIESLTHHVSMDLPDYERVIYRLDDVFQVAPNGPGLVVTHTFLFVVQSLMDIKLQGTSILKL
jgi:hypothetical protein